MDKNDLFRRLDETLAELKRERDELRVRAHLARMEASDEWKEIEAKLAKMEAQAKELVHEADHSVKEAAAHAAITLGEDIREGLKKFAKGS